MHSALTTPVEFPRAAPSPAAEHPLDQLLRTAAAAPAPADDGSFRFWACAHGPEGRSQSTAVWGLWLDQTVVFAADTESVAVGDPHVFPASVVQLEGDGRVRVVDGSAERVDDPALLARFVSQCEAKYGFEPDPQDPDTPVYTMRPGPVDSEQATPT
jgi:hypothetical protein